MAWPNYPATLLVNVATPSSVAISDGPNLDAFSRLRVSQPQAVFDAQLTYDLQPLLFEQTATNGGGGTSTVTHDSTNRCALFTFTDALTGAVARMQTYDHFRYQPGKSQAFFLTFNFITKIADCVKHVGIGDGSNGIELQQTSATTTQLVLYSDTANGDQTIAQADWSEDTLDGSGGSDNPSGLLLDLTKTQILVIDFQALYVGRVRIGFDIAGQLVYVHHFEHANLVATPYIQTANLPIRVGMTCSGTVSTTMRFICSSVISEGGQDDTAGYQFAVEGVGTAANADWAHILSVRPKTTFNSIANRTKFVLDSLDFLVTGTNPVIWRLCVGQAATGTAWSDANGTYSGMEYTSNVGTIDGAAAIVLASGYLSASATSKTVVSKFVSLRAPITLNAAGAVRANGTLSITAYGLTGTSVTRATMNWRELR